MIKLDGMVIIGSAGANAGKTELACALIRKFSKSAEITGIKVTTIKARDGQCPRGGNGCGVCSSLEGDFRITEETETNSGKDTAKLLAAGASRVFWLRVMKTSLEEAIKALLDMLGSDVVLVCESNSLRQVVEPGLFLMVKKRNSKTFKRSAEQVRKYADRIVISDGDSFNFDIQRIKLVSSPMDSLRRKWTMPEEATAIIMAGGQSHRMGADKIMLPIKGRPIIEHIAEQLCGCFSQILISANEPEKLAFLGFDVIPDRVAGRGPLMGIASALAASANELNFIIACDIPHIDRCLIRKMLAEAEGFDAVVPVTGDEKCEPLFAVYRKSAIKVMNEVLSAGGRKISDIFSRCRVKYIKLDRPQWPTNINTMDEYRKFREKYDA